MLEACPFEDKTRSLSGLFAIQIFVAIVIYMAEEFGRMYGLSELPLRISPVWPAAGVSLAALLLYGWKVWPALLIAFWGYNFPHLISSGIPQGISAVIAATVISLGSLLQACLGCYFLRRFGTIAFFNKYRSTLVFLIPAGMATCLTAPTVGVLALAFLGGIKDGNISSTWLTFWVGDNMGVFLFTPLIVGYALSEPMELTWKNIFELAALFGMLITASLGIFIAEYPIANWLLPFLLWAAFRFNIRGVSSALLIVTAIAVATTALGSGPFVEKTRNSSLFFLVTFIEIITAAMLILVSVLNERKNALKLLQDYNFDLENTIAIRSRQLQEAKEEIAIKEKLTSLSVLAAGISYEIKNPLAYIRDLAAAAKDCIDMVKGVITGHEHEISPTLAADLSSHCSTMAECVNKISDYEKQAHQVVETFLQHSRSESKKAYNFQMVNVHHILNSCCNNAKKNFEDKTSCKLDIIKNYGEELNEIQAIAFDLSRAFSNVIENALYAMKQRYERNAGPYQPVLKITTSNQGGSIAISIRDNGTGMSDAILRRIFQPFFTTKPLEEGTGLGLAIAHDIIVQEHHGIIRAASQKGAYTEISIILPSTL